jgi:hypothetical protein
LIEFLHPHPQRPSSEAKVSKVSLTTGLGATRPLIMLAGDQLPRIR